MRAHSLRTTFFAGTLVIVVPLVTAFAGVVYFRSRSVADEALRHTLELRARTVAGLLEKKGAYFEVDDPPPELPEYGEKASGAYFLVREDGGPEVMRSPSLGKESLPEAVAGAVGSIEYSRVNEGPFGAPCAVAVLSFHARVDEDDDPPEAGDPGDDPGPVFVAQVAIDSRDRDRSLALLATFLTSLSLACVGAALLGAALLSRRLLSPIRRMTEAARNLTPAAPERRLEPTHVVSELGSLAGTLNQAFDGLTEALRRQQRFTADASHELRTPVSVLLSNSELLLKRERSPAEYREGLERQRRVARRMSQIVDGLLLLARADAGHDDLERMRVDLNSIATSVCEEWQPIAEGSGVALECRNGAESRAVLDGDATRLQQLAANLVSNAVKFTPRGGRVSVETGVEGGDAFLRVTDTGPGIAPEHQKHLFERFYRVENGSRGRNGAPPGAGLGLAIVAWIVRAHGGTIEVRSREGAGATFFVRLPAAPAEPETAAEIIPPAN